MRPNTVCTTLKSAPGSAGIFTFHVTGSEGKSACASRNSNTRFSIFPSGNLTVPRPKIGPLDLAAVTAVHPFEPGPDGAFRAGTPQRLFTGAQVGMGAENNMTSYNPEYDVSADGTRFVVTQRVGG